MHGGRIDAGGQPTGGDFRGLFDVQYARLCRHLAYLVGDKGAAEDLAQEAFLKLLNSPPRDLENPGGWLTRVATNLAYNHLRREKGRRKAEQAEGRFPASGNPSPEEEILQREEIAVIRSVLDRLPPRERLCLLLRHSGHSYTDIAAMIRVKKTSVGTILARSQRKFKETYLQEKGAWDDVLW